MSTFRVKLRLIVILSFLLLISFAAMNIINYQVAKQSLRRNIIRNTLPVTSNNIYTEIQKDLMRPIFVSSLMANDTFLKDWVLGGEEDISRITRYLKEIKERYGFFSSFFVSARTMNYYTSTGIYKQVSTEDSHDVWYYDFLGLDVDYDLDVDTDEVSGGTLTIFINHRLRDYQGSFIGVTGVGLNMGLVGDLVNRYQETYDSNIYLVDRQGVIQVHPDSSVIQTTDIHNLEGLRTLAEEILSTGEGTALYEYDSAGRHILLEVRYVPEFNWYLLVEQDESTILSDIRSNLIRNLIIGFLVTCLVIAVTAVAVSFFQKKIEVMATTDELTGTANRREFDARMEQAVSLSGRQDIPLSLCIFDIDNFKGVNDQLGHLAGDRVIRSITALAESFIRSSDLLARWGGDEFVLMVYGKQDDAFVVMERIRRAVENEVFFPEGGNAPEITISCGITAGCRDDTPAAMLARADRALYQAKDKGKNRIEVV